MGQHAIACGLTAAAQRDIKGHAGFYCGGMNKEAEITVSTGMPAPAWPRT